MTRPLAALLALVALLLPVVTACSGGGAAKVEVEDWVADFCDRIVAYSEAVADAQEPLFDIDFEQPRDAKDDLLDVLDDVIALTRDLVSDLEKLGEPEIDGGSKVRAETIAHGREALRRAQDLRDDINDLDHRDQFFEDDVIDLFENTDTGGYRDRLDDLRDEHREVRQVVNAIEDDPECAAAAFAGDIPDPTPVPTEGPTEEPAETPTQAGTLTETEWARQFCTLDNDYFDALVELLGGFDREEPDLEARWDGLVTLVDEATFLSWDLADDILALPPTTAPGAEDLRALYFDAFDEAGDLFDDAYFEAVLIDTASEETWDEGFALVEPIVQQALDRIDRLISDSAPSPFWDFASNVPACAQADPR